MSVRVLIDRRDVRRAETDRLTAFLYLLIRDFATLGEIEQILDDVLSSSPDALCQDDLVTDYANRLKRKILDADSGR